MFRYYLLISVLAYFGACKTRTSDSRASSSEITNSPGDAFIKEHAENLRKASEQILNNSFENIILIGQSPAYLKPFLERSEKKVFLIPFSGRPFLTKETTPNKKPNNDVSSRYFNNINRTT